MSNLMIAYPNRADEATLSGGSWINAPLSNLQTRILAQQTRSTDTLAASTKFLIDLGQNRHFSVIGLISHNLTLDATFRISTSQTADFAVLDRDTGWQPVWPALFFPEFLDWEDDNWWSGQVSVEMLKIYPHNLISVFAPTFARYAWLEFNDTTNPAGYVSAGRLFIGNGWQPITNMSYGAALGYEDPTVVTTLPDGPEYFAEYPKYRVFTCQLDFLNEGEAYTQALELQWYTGVSKEVLVLPNQDDLTNLMRRSFLARMRKLSPIGAISYGIFGTQYEVKEIIG